MSEAQKVNILLVDDQPARLLSYESVLSSLGQNLITARSGLEALELLMSHEFAVVLLDVNMPGMDGFETAALIHEHPRFETTPIIFVTGVHVSDLDRLRGYKLGAVDYVSIPVVPEILRGKVAVLVELYERRRELHQLNLSLAQANARLAEAHSTLLAEKNRELERLNATLREANRHKDEFLAMLAHELRNPLAPIYNAAQLMRIPQLPPDQLAWAREVIERQLGHMTRLVDDLLDVSRITRGKITLSRATVELSAVVARALETVQPMLARRRLHLQVDVSPERLLIDGDLTRLTQVVGNILSNAVKYTGDDGRIELRAGRVTDRIEIRIRDNGIGIEPAVLASVFELFTQAGPPVPRDQVGLGIGLALVKRLVELHGGEVEAHSDGAGLGSEFVVRLPCLPGETAMLTTGDAAALAAGALGAVAPGGTAGAHTGERRILLADDNRDALESLSRLLEIWGHKVYVAADGVEAFAQAASLRPELALLDLGMPGLDGCEVARRIREQAWGRQMMLVALTGWGQAADRQRSLDAGFDSHWVKPLDLRRLTSLLEELSPVSGGRRLSASAG